MVEMKMGMLFVVGGCWMGVLGILVGGWSSKRKYRLIGGVGSGGMIMS